MTSHTFREGDTVHVRSINKAGVIVELLSADKYRVAIGSLSLICRSGEITPAQPPRVHPLGVQPPPLPHKPPPPKAIDLHGLTTTEAIRRVEAHVDRAILAGCSHLKVVHGLGTGRVQRAVHDYLSSLRVVRHFKINDFNPGETDVYL
jgi:DNA mismatch repair protein MutS2